jgi:Tfp pilus assembly protein FimT
MMGFWWQSEQVRMEAETVKAMAEKSRDDALMQRQIAEAAISEERRLREQLEKQQAAQGASNNPQSPESGTKPPE